MFVNKKIGIYIVLFTDVKGYCLVIPFKDQVVVKWLLVNRKWKKWLLRMLEETLALPLLVKLERKCHFCVSFSILNNFKN